MSDMVPPGPSSTLDQLGLRAAVQALLLTEPVLDELAGLDTGTCSSEAHPWRLYRSLGARRWLAPHWPERYGGAGQTWIEAAIVAEELARYGVPDTAIVNGIYNVGHCLLAAGTEPQRRRYLPPLAAGEIVATVLLTEPEAGSDLAALATTASATRDGWTISGTKLWSAKTHLAEIALCAARTTGIQAGVPPYVGISLYLVPLRGPGVSVVALDTFSVEALHQVQFTDLAIPYDALVGDVGEGWPVLVDALVLERAGLGYHGRVRRWFDALVGALRQAGQLASPPTAERVAVLGARVRVGRALAWRVIGQLVEGGPAAAATGAAMAKWYNTELATEIVDLAEASGIEAGRSGNQPDPIGSVRFDIAQREALGLTLAAGTSEMMLTAVQSELRQLLGVAR